MYGTSHVTAVARLIRVCTVTAAVLLVVAYVAVQAFAMHYNSPRTTQSVDARPATNTALAAAIAEQSERGLACREQPALTDTILFQALEHAEVQVLTFDEAIAAASERTGWIRRYCI